MQDMLPVDTGILYALADRRDAWHERVRTYLAGHPDLLLAPIRPGPVSRR